MLITVKYVQIIVRLNFRLRLHYFYTKSGTMWSMIKQFKESGTKLYNKDKDVKNKRK